MGRFREKIKRSVERSIERVLDIIDPPRAPTPQAPCPSCGGDVSENNDRSEVRNELVYFRCVCGHASAWYWNGHGPQLIYGQEPSDDPEIYEDLD